MPGNRCALVWTCRDEQREALLALDNDAFLAGLQERFGYRLGRLQQPGRRAAYPLKMMQVRQHYRPRVVLIGNAAHTVHPIAGQGFNLGIRDVSVLTEVLAEGLRSGADPGSEPLLQRYAQRRDADQQGITLFTDLLARLFSSPLPPLRLGRNLGLLGIDLLPPAKHALARRAMGLR
jgi:2-octaprenyl-6-methoxyphenol hydroxylase